MIQKTFKHNFTLSERDISATESNIGRCYVTEDGTFPSVTTVVGWEKQAFFKTWRKQNPEEAKRVTNRGNRLHSTIEKYLNNEVVISFYHRTLFLVFKLSAYKPTAAKPVSAAAYISSLQQYNSYALLPRGV